MLVRPEPGRRARRRALLGEQQGQRGAQRAVLLHHRPVPRRGGSCAHAPGEWSYRFFGGKVRLRDAQPPQVEAASGSYFDGSSVTDEQLTFRVSDAGSGIYRLRLDLGDDEFVADLAHAQDVTPTDRHATRFDVNAGNHDPYEFAHQQPCPATLQRTVGFPTSALPDGPAHLRAVVEDPAVGSTLSGTNGAWRNANTYASYRERCTVESGWRHALRSPRKHLRADRNRRRRADATVVYATNGIGEWTAPRSPFSEAVAPRGAAPSGPGAPTRPIPGGGPTNGGGTKAAEEPERLDAGAAPPGRPERSRRNH